MVCHTYCVPLIECAIYRKKPVTLTVIMGGNKSFVTGLLINRSCQMIAVAINRVIIELTRPCIIAALAAAVQSRCQFTNNAQPPHKQKAAMAGRICTVNRLITPS